MAPPTKIEDDSDDDAPLANRVKTESSTPKRASPPARMGFKFIHSLAVPVRSRRRRADPRSTIAATIVRGVARVVRVVARARSRARAALVRSPRRRRHPASARPRPRRPSPLPHPRSGAVRSPTPRPHRPDDVAAKKTDKDGKKKKKKKNKPKPKPSGGNGGAAVKAEKKTYELPGQKRDTPDEADSLRKFYVSLRTQKPESEMAETWLMEHGLLPEEEAKKAYKKWLAKRGRNGPPAKKSGGGGGGSSRPKSASGAAAKRRRRRKPPSRLISPSRCRG